MLVAVLPKETPHLVDCLCADIEDSVLPTGIEAADVALCPRQSHPLRNGGVASDKVGELGTGGKSDPSRIEVLLSVGTPAAQRNNEAHSEQRTHPQAPG